MLSFFKVNDPYRLVGVLIILLVIRLPFIISGIPMIEPELKWLLIGERLAHSDYSMYNDAWHYLMPLSAFAYKWIHILFGRTTLAYQLLSIVLVMVQAGIFNNVMLKNKAYNQNTYVPALVYMLMMNIFFDMFTLSPALLGMTFILLAINNLFKRMDNQTRDELFVNTGVYLGVAMLFYLPSFFYFIATIVALVIFTGSIVRRMFLLVYGFLLVLAGSAIYFYWNDSFLIFKHHALSSIWDFEPHVYLNWKEVIGVSSIPILIFIFSYIKMKIKGRYINYQVKIQQVMVMFLASGFFMFFIIQDKSTFQLIYFVPTVAFFIAHYLLTIRHWILAEASLLWISVLLILNNLFFYNEWLFVDRFVSYDKLKVSSSPYHELVANKRILVLGKETSIYQNAKLATPYLEWQLAAVHFHDIGYYDHLIEIYEHFQKDRPEVIIDEIGVIPDLFEKLPTIAALYTQGPKDNTYLLKN